MTQQARSLAPSLGRAQLVVEAVKWGSTSVRSGGVSGPLHDEWTVRICARSKDEPVRAAIYLESGAVRYYDKSKFRKASDCLEIEVKFQPWNWASSDYFSIGGWGVRVEDPALHGDLPAAITMAIGPGEVIRTGTPTPILRHDRSRTTLGLVVVCSADTAVDRMRWRLKPRFAPDLASHSYLQVGSFSGQEPIGS